jgi:hypothetical protein
MLEIVVEILLPKDHHLQFMVAGKIEEWLANVVVAVVVLVDQREMSSASVASPFRPNDDHLVHVHVVHLHHHRLVLVEVVSVRQRGLRVAFDCSMG